MEGPWWEQLRHGRSDARQADRYSKIRYIQYIQLHLVYSVYSVYSDVFEQHSVLFLSVLCLFFPKSHWLRGLPIFYLLDLQFHWTQNFHSPSLLTRFPLCLIASLDEATVSRSLALCVVIGVPPSLSCSLSHGDSWKTGRKSVLQSENFHPRVFNVLPVPQQPALLWTNGRHRRILHIKLI